MEEQNLAASAEGVTVASHQPVLSAVGTGKGTARVLCSIDTFTHPHLCSQRAPEAADRLRQVGFRDNKEKQNCLSSPRSLQRIPQRLVTSLWSPDR